MPTSLAEQLNKLKTPQASLLTHRKFKPSFLFDAKEAAKFDRDTLYELGLSGLEELKKLNPHFSIFEDTLFDLTSKSFERSVESKEANEKLDCHIKTFLILLSPYFLLKPAHKALEWLINRYHIQDFNVDDILFLILPYHETLLFARMLQLLPLKPETGNWHWLYPVKKGGVPLSKTALLNRASSDMSFLKFVCNMPIEAIKISGNKASSLGTLYAFYCTTVIGGLEYAKPITELHVSHILPSLMSALGSSLPDFIASGYMIIARLVSKACLGEKIFEGLLNKISKVDSVKMRSETSLILVLLCQNNENKYSFPEKAVSRLGKEQWFLTCLSTLNNNKILIIPLVLSMLQTSLQLIQKGDEDLKVFVKNLLTKIHYDSSDAEKIFKCLLREFNSECGPDILKWYSELLKEMENIFPMVFDKTASEVLSKQTKSAESIRKLLGVNTSRNDLYKKLVHPNKHIRLAAIKDIRQNYNPDQLAWLKGPLLERLNDDSPEIVNAILKLPNQFFTDTASTDVLILYLLKVIAKFGASDVSLMKNVAYKMFHNANENYAILILIVLLNNPAISDVLKHLNEIDTPLPESCKYFTELQKYFVEESNDNETNKNDIGECLWNSLESSKSLPSCEDIIDIFHKYEPLKSFSGFWFSATLLIANSLPDNLESDLVKKIETFLVEYIQFSQRYSWKESEKLTKHSLKKLLKASQHNQLPIEGAVNCMSKLASKLLLQGEHQISNYWFNFDKKENSVLISLYRIIHEGCLSKSKRVIKAFRACQNGLIKDFFPSVEAEINFLMNIVLYDEKLMMKNLILITDLLGEHPILYSKIMENNSYVFPGLLLLLASTNDKVRTIVLGILEECLNFNGYYKPLATELVSQSEEIKLDNEQIVVVLYSKLSPSKEIKSLLKKSQHETLQNILNKLMSIIIANNTPIYIKAKFLKLLELVQSKEMFLQLKPLALELVTPSKVLDQCESEIYCYIMKRFNESIAEYFNSEDLWELFTKTIQDHNTQLVDIDTQKTTCPAAFLLKQVSKEFFDKLPTPILPNQERLLSLVVNHITDIDKVEVINASTVFFKRIVLDCKILVNLLAPMLTIALPTSIDKSNVKTKRRSVIAPPSIEILETSEWKRGICLLESIQNKKKLLSKELLIPTLFNILKKCLHFEQQSSVEYTKQLVLSCLLRIGENIDTTNPNILSEEVWHVDLIVDCVRVSHNPQTHHHALLALTHIAKLIPEQVLHNIMAIFTFIGSSVLRKDDAYSFQIITKIIDTIIPVLVKHQTNQDEAVSVAGVIRVFVTALLDVPEHRRIPLLVKLMNTIDAHTYLWLFLCLVFECHVTRPMSSDIEIKGSLPQETNMPKKLQITHQLCAEFTPEVILNTSYKLLDHLCSLPHEKDEKELHKFNDKLINFIFNIERNNGKQLRHYKYIILTFLSSLLSSNNFVQQLAELTHDEHAALESTFGIIVEQNLIYIKSVSKQCEESSSLPTAKYWKVVLNQSYDILDKTNALLPTEGFLRIINSLLGNELEAVRRKAMELLGWRLQQPRSVPADILLTLLPPLIECLDSISLNEDTTQDVQLTQQTALFSLKLMARHLATLHPEIFIEILEKITNILCHEELPLHWPVLGSLVLCVGELVYMLKIRALKLLNKFMPTLLSVLHTQIKKEREELLLVSIVTAVQKIVDVLVPLLSPYLDTLLYEISILSIECDCPTFTDTQKMAPLPLKLKLIRQKISSESPGRVLVPAVVTCYKKLIKHSKYSAIGPLMSILSESFTSSADLTVEVSELLLLALDVRSSVSYDKLTPVEVNVVEDPAIAAFTQLVLKMTESTFRPLYNKVYDWALRSQGDKQRAITFFRLSYQLALSLKSLFSLFAGIFVFNVAELLDNNNIMKNTEQWFDGEYAVEKGCILIDNILQTLLTIFTYDSHKFVTKERFNKLKEPLIDQLENQLGGEDMWKVRCTTLITPCIAQMSTSIIDDSLWKHLNYHILLKMRNENAQVRLVAVRTVCSLAGKLGEDFLPLLPETVPFLAELLEDDDEDVERECQKVVSEMEEIIGEPIQKYF